METTSIPMIDLATLLATMGSTGQAVATGTALPETGASPFMALLNQAVADGETLGAETVATIVDGNATVGLLAPAQEVSIGQIPQDQLLSVPSEPQTALAATLLPVLAPETAHSPDTHVDESSIVVAESSAETAPANADAAATQAMQQLLVASSPATPVPAQQLGTQSQPAAVTETMPAHGQQQPLTATFAATFAAPFTGTNAEPAAGQNARISGEIPTAQTTVAAQQTAEPMGQGFSVKDTPAEAAQRVPSNDQKPLKPHEHALQQATQVLEVQITGEPVKQTSSIPRDLAIEVAISEGSADPAQHVQAPANAGQQQDLANEQRASHAFVQGGKTLAPQPANLVETATVSVNHESVIEQVKDRLSVPEARTDGNQIRLQLRPAGLGELQITMRMDDQKLRVEILAENKAVKTALLEHADTLKDVLAKQHITVDRFDVGTSSNNGSGQLFREGSRPEDQRTLPRYAANGGFKQTVALPVAAWQPRGNALVDVRF